MRNKLFRAAAAILCVLTLTPFLTGASVQADQQQTMTNLIFFAKFKGDAADVLNVKTEYEYDGDKTVWDEVKADFNDNSAGSGVDDSFKAFINAISCGKLTVNNYFPQEQAGAITFFELSHTLAEYESGGGDDSILAELGAAVTAGAIELPEGVKLDNREEGVIDNVTVILQNADGSEDGAVLYPHKSVNSVRYIGGVLVGNYNFINTYAITEGQRQGVISHEFLHSVGFPDLYRYSGDGTPVGIWDIMSGVSPFQQYPLTYMRSTMGWLELAEKTGNDTTMSLTLNVATAASGDRGFIIKTPMSDSEFFVVEYRREKPGVYGFETLIPNSGLVIYRVDNGVENHTNAAGGNYIYIFREGETSLSGAEVLPLANAVLTPWEGETAYGSADMTKSWDDDVIFYSDGMNSGITITNIAGASDGTTITFDVTFPDYAAMGLWQKQGASLGSDNSSAPSLAFGEDGTPYMAYAMRDGMRTYVHAAKYADGKWTNIGETLGLGDAPKLQIIGGVPYVLYADLTNGKAVLKKLSGSSWQFVDDVVTDQYELGFAVSESGTYISSLSGGANTLTVYKLESDVLVSCGSVSGSMMSGMSLTVYDGAPVASYYSFFGKDNAVKLMRVENGTFTAMAMPESVNYAGTRLCADGDSLYMLMYADSTLKLHTLNGGVWRSETVAGSINCVDTALTVSGGKAYVGLVNGADSRAEVRCSDGETWTRLSGVITANVGFMPSLTVRDGKIYAPVAFDSNVGGAAALYWNEIPAPPSIENSVNVDSVTVADATASVSVTLTEGKGKLYTASFADGRFVSLSTTELEATSAAVSKTVSVGINGGTDAVRAMLCGEDGAPLCESSEWLAE